MSGLIGRQAERERLESALEQARLGHGSIVLLSGEAGVGKTRLAADLAAGSDAVRPARRADPGRRRSLRPGGGRAAQLPALAPGRARASRARCAPSSRCCCPSSERPRRPPIARRCSRRSAARSPSVAAERHALVVLDDLQWSDEATLELLAALAEPLGELAVLVIAAYRSDGLPRDHGVRRLRNDLRRTGRLDELVLRPLALEETAALLAARARRAALAAARPRDPRPHRGDPVLRRGARRRAARQRRGRRPGGAGSSCPATATSRSPTPCATPC